MSYIYLASPYSHPDPAVRQKRYEDVLEITAKLSKIGYVVFSPIVHSHPMSVHHDMPGDWAFWSKIDYKFIDACREIWVLDMDGWDKSVGIKAEMEYAKSIGKMVSIYGLAHPMDQEYDDFPLEIRF